MNKLQKTMIGGGVIGALLGVGAAYLLSMAPGDEETETESVTATELITLTGAGATLIRRLNDLRLKL